MNEEELRERQKKEQKELQGKIQALKKSIPKGDKKAKKRSAEEIAVLQKELTDKHEQELKELETALSSQLDNLHITQELVDNEEITLPESTAPRKQSKAERRRDAKSAATQAKLVEIYEMGSEVTARSQEMLKLSETVRALALSVHEIPADGNCMFYAIQHQLDQRNMPCDVSELREIAATYMSENKDDFLPFLVHPKTGDMLSVEQFGAYCSDMKCNGVWGGMHEAQALSTALKLPIKIVQADCPEVLLGEGLEGEEIVLLFYRHKFGLGEHYDSVTRAPS